MGYATGGFTSATILSESTGVAQGFDDYVYGDLIPANETVDKAIGWMTDHEDEPFFLFVHLFDPHSPYEPPKSHMLWGNSPSDKYDGEVHFADEHLGRLFDAIDDLGLKDDTVIMLTGDHGESLGEREYFGHDICIYDNCLRVPMILYIPGQKQSTISQMTSHIDIMPTLLAIAGAKNEGGYDGVDMLGKDITNRGYLFAQRRIHTLRDEEMGRTYAIINGSHKYIQRSIRDDEMYDFEDDPKELKNILIDDVKAGRGLNIVLNAWLNRTGDKLGDIESSEKRMDILRSHGYVQ